MASSSRLFLGCLLTAALALVSCSEPPTTVCLGLPPACDGELRPTTVEIAPAALAFTAFGQTQQMTATVLDQLGQTMDTIPLSWSSSTPGIATVDQSGLVTAVGNGSATITAIALAANGDAPVDVQQTPASAMIAPTPVTLPGPGAAALIRTTVFDAGGAEIVSPDITWTSDDTTVVTVIDEGVVTGVAQGSTTVRMQATSGGASTNTSTTVTVTAPTPGTVRGSVRDAETSISISGATVDITGPGTALNTTTDGSGGYSFTGIAGGTYLVTVTAGGYVNATAVDLMVVDGVGDIVRADFAMTPNGSTRRFGGISGRVYFGGAPLSGATVSISGGAQTNGIFQSTTTDADGTYALVGLGLDDTSGTPIAEFTVLSTFGFSVAQDTVVPIQHQTIPNVDLNLVPNEGLDVYFEDDFESTVIPWSTTGFWNRSTLVGVSNAAFPTYVNLAPDDTSNGALPLAVQGQYAFWYGDDATGNFMGTQAAGDGALSGGTGETANSGSLTSPPFLIPAGAAKATLRFSTWFEIESVNPNAQGFDIMNIGVLPSGATEPTIIARLNPFVDPTLSPRAAIPFTSGGFNLPPVWRTEFLDLSTYAGQSIRLVFEFDTVDQLYNGFRGWLLDEVSVTSLASGAAASVLAPAPGPGAAPPSRSP